MKAASTGGCTPFSSWRASDAGCLVGQAVSPAKLYAIGAASVRERLWP
jgi:hypothetical protein